jgi:hypothetical protein
MFSVMANILGQTTDEAELIADGFETLGQAASFAKAQNQVHNPNQTEGGLNFYPVRTANLNK